MAMKQALTQRSTWFRLSAAGAMNALLWLYMSVHPGFTGRVEIDSPKYFFMGCFAAMTTLPSLGVLRAGTGWHRLCAVALLALPGWVLFTVVEWAIDHW